MQVLWRKWFMWSPRLDLPAYTLLHPGWRIKRIRLQLPTSVGPQTTASVQQSLPVHEYQHEIDEPELFHTNKRSCGCGIVLGPSKPELEKLVAGDLFANDAIQKQFKRIVCEPVVL